MRQEARLGAVALSLVMWLAPQGGDATPKGIHIEPLYRVPRHEGIFAYGRISPDGRLLAYTAQLYSGTPRASRLQRVIRVDDQHLMFNHPGLDGYWSPDGRRLIFISKSGDLDSVSVLDIERERVMNGVAPIDAGDYPSWAVRDGRDLIVTVLNRYYYLRSDEIADPIHTVKACADIGTGQRPLISKQGTQLSTFWNGELIVRHLDDCEDIVRTHMSGGKADFSYDGRFIAFHSEKTQGIGYEIRVIDLQRKTVATIGDLPGSSLFPSWTRDGRIVFRYDDSTFRGFMIASGALSAEFRPLPTADAGIGTPQVKVKWNDMFIDRRPPDGRLTVVLVWAPWNPHSLEAIDSVEASMRRWQHRWPDVEARMAVEPTSWPPDAEEMLGQAHSALPGARLRAGRVSRSAAANQIPALLLFDGGTLVNALLGAQRPEDVFRWVEGYRTGPIKAVDRAALVAKRSPDAYRDRVRGQAPGCGDEGSLPDARVKAVGP